MDRLINMMVFAQVAESASFSRAAEALGMAKSSVSKKVRDLERELGVRLIQRTTRQFRVTEAGEALQRHCQQIRRELDLARDTLSGYVEQPSGTLRIGASPLFGNVMIAPLIPAFQQLYPQVSVELLNSERLSDLVGEGYDLLLRMGKLADSSLVATRLFIVRSVLCASPGYLRQAGVPTRPADLERHRYIRWMAPSAPPYVALTFSKAGRSYTVPVSSQFSSNDALATKMVALCDGGLAMLPNYAIHQELEEGRLVALLTDYRSHEAPISLVYPHREQIAPKVRAFADYLVARMRDVDL